ncbi:hypothetical protein Tco_0199226 [Tanacetum coccineum]
MVLVQSVRALLLPRRRPRLKGVQWYQDGTISSNMGQRSSRESKNVCGEVGGVEKISSTGSKFMVRGEECLEGCVGASEGKVNEGRDDFGVSKSLIGEIPRVVIGESGGEVFRDNGGAIWQSVRGDSA